MLELWIARDKDGWLGVYVDMPEKLEEVGSFCPSSAYSELNKSLFQEVTWENSPRKVKIELV